MEAVAEADVKPERKPNPNEFGPGNAVGKHGKKGKPLKVKKGETQLEAMKWVLSHRDDETHQQREMRGALREDRQRFLDRMLAMEKMQEASGSTSSSSTSTSEPSSQNTPATAVVDLGTERCLELIDDLIERLTRPI